MIQYATQSIDPLEIRVYAGADASFTIYEDEGDTYNYEMGQHAQIPLTWNNASQDADHRRAHRQLHRHAGDANVQRRVRRRESRQRPRRHRHARPGGPVRRHAGGRDRAVAAWIDEQDYGNCTPASTPSAAANRGAVQTGTWSRLPVQRVRLTRPSAWALEEGAAPEGLGDSGSNADLDEEYGRRSGSVDLPGHPDRPRVRHQTSVPSRDDRARGGAAEQMLLREAGAVSASGRRGQAHDGGELDREALPRERAEQTREHDRRRRHPEPDGRSCPEGEHRPRPAGW